jgi:YebC/PmpR family DNA-binding regulatory protein
MSGHSKWSTIKRKKAAVDAKRSKIWTKIVKEIQVAARLGGGDPGGNPRLRLALERAKGVNIPKDSVKRAIDKGTGAAGGAELEDVIYEGYGPSGVALVIECMTDNRNRTVGEIRHAFEKFGGNLGQSGSVAWIFKKRGVIHILKDGVPEERVFEIALEAGAEDVRDEEEVFTVDTDPASFLAVKEALETAGLPVENAEIDNIPETRVALPEDVAESLSRLISQLEDLEDVQNVYANYEVPEEVAERLGL